MTAATIDRIDIASRHGAYQVMIGAGLLDRLGELVATTGTARPQALVSDTTVGPLYGARVAASLGLGEWLELEDGEISKRWPTVERTVSAWLAAGLHRRDVAVALGGGVLTDLTGFAAAVYLRGIDWVAAPTTLLGMVDAAIGGKTGCNLDQGKNLVGAFWPPRLVVADVDVLATLPARELRAGLAEVVKAAWIADRGMLAFLERTVESYTDLPPSRWRELVARAARVKAHIVAADELEAGRRAALNLGHTIGHALEAVTGYERFLHGEAVAWGLVAEAILARRLGLLSRAAEARLRAAVAALGPLPPVADLEPGRLLEHVAHDKKRDDLGIAWALPGDDGVLLDQRAGAAEVAAALAELSGFEARRTV